MAIIADFNNCDADGFLRLNCSGTLRDLERHDLKLHEGLLILVSDGDLRVEVEVVPPGVERIWRGKFVSNVEERDSESGQWSAL